MPPMPGLTRRQDPCSSALPFSFQAGEWTELPQHFPSQEIPQNIFDGNSLLPAGYQLSHVMPARQVFKHRLGLTQQINTRGQKFFPQPKMQEVFGKSSMQLSKQELGKGSRSLSCKTFLLLGLKGDCAPWLCAWLCIDVCLWGKHPFLSVIHCMKIWVCTTRLYQHKLPSSQSCREMLNTHLHELDAEKQLSSRFLSRRRLNSFPCKLPWKYLLILAYLGYSHCHTVCYKTFGRQNLLFSKPLS